MTPVEELKKIAARFPESSPSVTDLPSGAVLLDLNLNGVHFCAEYFPAFNKYGLSKTAGSSPFFEGAEESFSSPILLEQKIAEILKTKA